MAEILISKDLSQERRDQPHEAGEMKSRDWVSRWRSHAASSLAFSNASAIQPSLLRRVAHHSFI